MHQFNKQILQKRGVPSYLFPLISSEYAEYELLQNELSDLRTSSSLDLAHGDSIERTANECLMTDRAHRISIIQNKIRKICALIENIEDPECDTDYCAICGDFLPCFRIIQMKSIICTNCAQLAEN